MTVPFPRSKEPVVCRTTPSRGYTHPNPTPVPQCLRFLLQIAVLKLCRPLSGAHPIRAGQTAGGLRSGQGREFAGAVGGALGFDQGAQVGQG
jgi:hypothetical protein